MALQLMHPLLWLQMEEGFKNNKKYEKVNETGRRGKGQVEDSH